MSIFNLFHQQLQHAIVHRLGWQSLRPVQELAGTAILDGKNVIILAPTAGGKTEASFFPVLSDLLKNQTTGVKCIYISPLRALLNNQEERLTTYTEMLGLSCFKWHGEAKQKSKKAFIGEPADLLLITPESLEVMLISPRVPAQKLFKHLRFVIIDEIHELASCDRGAHMLSVLERIRVFSDDDFQRIGLSATVGNPEDILDWMQGSSKRDKQIIDPPKQPSKKSLEIKYMDEFQVPIIAAQKAQFKKSLFFCNSRALAEKVGKAMEPNNIKIFVHHSSISREERQEAEESMMQDSNACIICTSTLELGIDIGKLDCIFQAESPSTVSSFLQRLGRTGRRENTKMNTVFFTTTSESLLQGIAIIELARNYWVENVQFNERSWHILVHQLMAMCLQYGSITRSTAWGILSKAFCFHGITNEQFNLLIDYLIGKNFLYEESGRISMGVDAEKKFGYKNFMEIYSVFSSTKTYDVKTIGGRPLGSIEGRFADTLEEESCFLLTGTAWVVKRIEQAGNTIWVKKAASGKAPMWGGFAPNMLSYELCRKIYSVLTDNERYTYCDHPARELLDEIREDKLFLKQSFAPFDIEDDYIYWWTYAGGKINNTLKYAILYQSGFSIISNNYYLKFKGGRETIKSFSEMINKMKEHEFWDDAELKKSMIKMLSGRRLSKFQDCLPEMYQSELIPKAYLDIPGTNRFLTKYK